MRDNPGSKPGRGFLLHWRRTSRRFRSVIAIRATEIPWKITKYIPKYTPIRAGCRTNIDTSKNGLTGKTVVSHPRDTKFEPSSPQYYHNSWNNVRYERPNSTNESLSRTATLQPNSRDESDNKHTQPKIPPSTLRSEIATPGISTDLKKCHA